MNELEDLYREVILDHYRSPRNRGELPVPPAHRVEGYNPLCGDEVILYIDVSDGELKDIRIGGQGCSISQSSASLMSAAVKGLDLEKVRELEHSFKTMMSIYESAPDKSGENASDREPVLVDPESLGELAALQGVVKFPVRIKCATLAWNALMQGLDEIEFDHHSD
ncbi:MAG TPA: SUF system NifU family Fe-S cluster assembly protein [Acidimicrobiales bacterium]|nr:SUF system NifU family Fe-S cluster assembly protein [Acidimicrobiales bacterium]